MPSRTTMPSHVAAIALASNTTSPGNWVAYGLPSDGSIDTKSWLCVIIEVTTATGAGHSVTSWKYTFEVYSDADKLITHGTYGADTSADVANKQKYYKIAQQNLKSWTASGKTLGGINAEVSEKPLALSPLTNGGTASDRFNPPSHFATRGLPLTDNINLYGKGVVANANAKKQLEAFYSANTRENNALGKIYQNSSSAAAMNTKAIKDGGTGLTISSDPIENQLWGFRFTYNPTTFSYSTTIDTSIDWMQAPKDPSKFFGGNTSITFDLYLNRIADMTALKPENAKSLANGYPQTLSDIHKWGILNRGTEWDLEYLYRVVNGDPSQTSLLSPGTTQPTSDYGYITGMPVWLHFHDNMVYRGSLSGLSVNHVMFTDKMVPMLSVVTLSFIRYPESNDVYNKVKAVPASGA